MPWSGGPFGVTVHGCGCSLSSVERELSFFDSGSMDKMIRYGEVSNEIPKMEGFKKTSKDGDMFVAAALRSARQVNCDAQFFPEMSSCEPKTSRFEMTRESKEMQRAKRVSKFVSIIDILIYCYYCHTIYFRNKNF